ncbi:probable G-protein coupled receptor No18 [Argopecten irradians]|uniref:probable G-protein coupled receptor No18 n=1 Tax=Argopecten irradians TaxID=31199 RepID=UPI0037186F25
MFYTNGSKDGDNVAAACCTSNHCSSIRLPDVASIFSAEACAIGLALAHIEEHRIEKAIICSDSLSNVTNTTSATSRAVSVGTYIVVTLSAIGLIENGVIVILLFTRPLLRQRPHVIFTLSLSCSDFLSSFIVILIIIARFQMAIYSKGFCAFTYTASVICFGTSLLQALIISLERVLAISSSSTYIRIFQGYRKYIVLLTAWLVLSIYSIALVMAFPITGSHIGCVVTYMYNKVSYFGISLGTQIIFIPLVFGTLVLYAIAVYRLNKRMKQVSFTNRVAVPRVENRVRTINDDDGTVSTVHARFEKEEYSESNVPDGNSLSVRRDYLTEQNASTSGLPATSTSTDMTTSTKEKKLLKKETCNIRKLSGALRTVALVQLCLFVSFVPLSFARVLILIGVKEAQAAEGVISILPLLHPVINPILYVWLIKEFRMSLLCKK